MGALSVHAKVLSTELIVDGQVGGAMTAGKPSKWEFGFRDAETGEMAHHFHVMHEKPMHLIVVSRDLSHFAHVHPVLKEHSFKPFSIVANGKSADPDNFAQSTLIPFAGPYYLFAEVMPMDYGMLLFPYDLQVNGEARVDKALIPDGSENGTIIKYFDENGEVVAKAESAFYRTKLQIQPLDHCEIVLPRFELELGMTDGLGGFVPVMDLEPWLQSYGHAFVIGKNGALAAAKIVQHLHAVWPLPSDDISQDERGPFIELAAHSHGFSTPTDIYRTWIQIKRGGKVLSLQFTFDWNLEEQKEKSRGSFCFGRSF
ncbi:MAG TPA: hypothetical protein VM432_11625 [Bdellovibrionales bacterium]|nr:hypothetical protein [Bdellovibrionales bacterium]